MSIRDIILVTIRDYKSESPMDRGLIEKALIEAGKGMPSEELWDILVKMNSNGLIIYGKPAIMADNRIAPLNGFKLTSLGEREARNLNS